MHQLCVKIPVYETLKPGSHPPVTIKYLKHCFDIPEFVEIPSNEPDPGNFPDLKLATTVLSLVDYARPLLKDAELAEKFAEIANGFIEKVRKGLPEGVSIVQ